jgi:hypothetical protein
MPLKSHACNHYVVVVKMKPRMSKPAVCDALSFFEYHITNGRGGLAY